MVLNYFNLIGKAYNLNIEHILNYSAAWWVVCKLSMDLIWWCLLNYFCFQNFFIVFYLLLNLFQLIFWFGDLFGVSGEIYKHDFFWFYLFLALIWFSCFVFFFLSGFMFMRFWFWWSLFINFNARHKNWINDFLFQLGFIKILTSFIA